MASGTNTEPSHVGAGKPLSGAWRDETRRKADELEALAEWMWVRHSADIGADGLLTAIRLHLENARQQAERPDSRRWWEKGLSRANPDTVDAALGNLDAAEAGILRLSPATEMAGQMPSVEAQVYRHLPKADPRRRTVEDVAHAQRNGKGFDEASRDAVVGAYHAAGSQRRRELIRVASFTRILLIAALVLSIVAVGVAVGGLFFPKALPLCFHPEDKGLIACPLQETPADENGAPEGQSGDFDEGIEATARPGDLLVVEIVGMLAAALAVVAALARMRGSSTPYRLPLAVALLKLPAGAVTAVLGLLFMRGQFVPGLTALDSSAQILAWAILFGYAQQLFTGMVDQQAHGVLKDVGGRGASGEREVGR